MKTIQKPADITLPDGSVLSFYAFVADNLLADNQFGQTLNDVRLAAHIKTAASSDGHMQLSEPAYEKLVQVMEHPLNGYNPKSAILLLPFFDAISNAQ